MIKLRRAEKKDKKAILEISRTIWDGEDYIPNIIDKWLDDYEGEFTVAELDGKVKGFAKFTVLRPREFWLEGIRVNEKVRGMGIGKAITHYYIEKAKEMKYESLALSTYIENYESIKIIEDNGFAKTTSFKLFYKTEGINFFDVKKYERITNIEDVLYIFDTEEMKKRNNYLALDWTFIRLDEKLLNELLEKGSIYGLKENGKVKSTIILSDKMAKNNELSIAYLDGREYYIDGIKFAINKFRENMYNGLIFMCPDIEELKTSAYNVGMGSFDNHSTDVFVYEYIG